MSHYCSYSKEEKSNSRTKLFFLTLFSAYFYGGRRKIQSLIKVKHFSTWSQYIYTPNQVGNFISDLKYSITLNEQVVNRDNTESWGMEAGYDTAHTSLGWFSQHFSRGDLEQQFPKKHQHSSGLAADVKTKEDKEGGEREGELFKGKVTELQEGFNHPTV